MFIDFRKSGSEKGANEEFPALDFCLDYYEGEVRFWVHVAGHLFDEFDLLFYSVGGAFD